MNRQLARWAASLVWALPVALILLVWESAGRADPKIAFFFSYPGAIARDLVTGLVHEQLARDVAYTLAPAIVGLLLGALLGGAAGFALITSPRLAKRVGPAVAFLGAFPVFAIAPMTLVWFGLGVSAKVFLAFLACVFIFLQAAHRGGLSVPPNILAHFSVHGFSESQIFSKVRLPYALDWLLSAFKTGANLALLGVFVGEFIASEHGLARVMLSAGALYNVKRVLAAALLFTLVAVLMMGIADIIGAQRNRLLRWISVPGGNRTWKET
jgi:NitT/TauT family transport system permease protein